MRYLKNADSKQIVEIFKRINNTEYALNKMERLNAQWGDSEFVCFCKQLVEQKLDIDKYYITYLIPSAERKIFLDFFHGAYDIFSETDISRMYSLQYVLSIVATLLEHKYFRRNEEVQKYIESYNDEFPQADEIKDTLLKVVNFIKSLNLPAKSYWFNKANIFSLIVELSQYDLSLLDAAGFKLELEAVERVLKGDTKIVSPKELTRLQKYFDVAKEAVNEKNARQYRGTIISGIINKYLAPE